MERIYRLADFIMKLAYLNLLAIFYTVIGLFIFGFFPALTALFYIVRKWLTGYSDIPITKNFWFAYKKEFVRSNVIGAILFLSGLLLFINLSIAEVVNEPIIRFSYYILLLVTILFACMCLYVFPVYVHFNGSMVQMFKNAFLFLFVQPIHTVCMVAGGVIILYFMLRFVPGLIPFFSMSIFAFIVMFFSLRKFERIVRVADSEVTQA